MKLFKFIYSVTLLVLPLTLLAQDISFNNTILQVIAGFNQQDAAKINTLLHKKIGIIVLFRIGAELGSLQQQDSIDFKYPIPEYLPYTTLGKVSNKIYNAPLPHVNCDNNRWSKQGIYYNTLAKDKLFMNIVNYQTQYNDVVFNKKTLEIYRMLNNQSRRIVAVDENGDALVFYLTYINRRWYLTILDRVSDDCSA